MTEWLAKTFETMTMKEKKAAENSFILQILYQIEQIFQLIPDSISSNYNLLIEILGTVKQ